MGQMKGNGQTGQTTADDGDITFHGESAKNAVFGTGVDTFGTIGDLRSFRSTSGPVAGCGARDRGKDIRSGSNSVCIEQDWTTSQV
jgi:hypothetical protein